MFTTIHRIGTLTEVFNDAETAQAEVRDLKELAFADSLLFVLVNNEMNFIDEEVDQERNYEGAAGRLGIGAICGLGILIGFVLGIGPTFSGGVLGVLLSSAIAGAAMVGTAGTIIGLGVLQENAGRHGGRLRSRATVVTVIADPRSDVSSSVLNRFNVSNCASSQAM